MAEEPLFDLSGHIQSHWTDQRAARVRGSIERRDRHRRWIRWALGTSGLLLTSCLVLAWFVRQSPPAPLATGQPPAASAAPPHRDHTEPTATPLTADTELVVDPQGAGRAFVLRRGSARFVVSHDERYPFRVRAGALVVEDLGTIFSVARLSDYQFDVAVEEGHVAVLCEESRVEIGSGRHQTFTCGEPARPVTVGPPSPSIAPPAIKPVPQRSQRTMDSPSQAAPTWRLLAERGQYREAYDSLRREPEPAVRDETHELLLAADTARLSGHANDAVPYLRRILVQHGGDPRAHLAAFTLGRVLLDELGRPAEAAQAFESARAPHAPLAEDALAREVEAWARAGNTRRAHTLALEYQRRYPQGRRLRAVTKFGVLP